MTTLALTAALMGLGAGDPAIPAAVESRALESTVRVFQPSLRGEGSGVVVMYQGGTAYILTASHVVPPGQNGDLVEITFFAKGKPAQMLKGQVSSRMNNEDLAVIIVRMKQPPPGVSPICPKESLPSKFLKNPLTALTVGMGVGPVGIPEAVIDRVKEHKLIKKDNGSEAFHWEAEKPQAVGRSGGPLLDSEGRVIGICSGTRGNKGYYVSGYEIRAALSRNGWEFLIR